MRTARTSGAVRWSSARTVTSLRSSRMPTRRSSSPISTWATSAASGWPIPCCAMSGSSSRSTSCVECGMSAPASLSEPVFPPLRINPALVRGILVGFIRNEVRKVGFERVVLGLSGGVDSSLVATLATEALGPKNVVAFIMPYKTSDPKSKTDALQVVQQLGIDHLEVDISPQIDAYFARFPDADQKRRGNKMELLLGYGTIYGDMASAINPIGDLYKTQIWQLADALGVPTAIVQKAPSADLWAGQSDETELGFQYRMIDQ